jgi:hypothetical protein
MRGVVGGLFKATGEGEKSCWFMREGERMDWREG